MTLLLTRRLLGATAILVTHHWDTSPTFAEVKGRSPLGLSQFNSKRQDNQLLFLSLIALHSVMKWIYLADSIDFGAPFLPRSGRGTD